MRVRITAKAGYSNPRRGIELSLGETAEVSDDLAVKLFTVGLAVPALASEVETVSVAPPENTAKRVSKPAPPLSSPAKKKSTGTQRKKASE